jgi:hypothetical protein
MPATATLAAGDLEVGAVEIKNAATDDRAVVAATGSVAEGGLALAVQAPVLGATTGAALDADGTGTIQQYLRGILKYILARLPALGPQTAATSMSVTPDSGNAAWAASGLAKESTLLGLLSLDLSAAGGTPLAYDATAKTAQLAAGKYALHSTTACNVRTGPQATVVATTSEYLLSANETILVTIDVTNDTISAIKNTVAGTLYFVRVL